MLHGARVFTYARHVGKEGVTIGRVLGGEGGHPDRLRILHLLEDRIQISIDELSSETCIRMVLRRVSDLVGYFSGTLRLSAKRLTSSVCSW